MIFLHEFPNRKDYKFRKGVSKYDGTLKNLNIQVENRHFLVIQDFFWIEWLFYELPIREKFIHLSYLWDELTNLGISDINASSINKYSAEESRKFIQCIEQMGLSKKMQGFGFLYFDNIEIRKEYFVPEYVEYKSKINKVIDEIYDHNEAIIMYWSCYYTELIGGKLKIVDKLSFDISMYVECSYSTQEMERINLIIKSTCKTIYSSKKGMGQIAKNYNMWERIMSNDCEFYDLTELVPTKKAQLEEHLNLFLQNQYFPDNIRKNDYKYLVNIGYIKLLYTLSNDLLIVESYSSKNIILKSIIEASIMLCYINKKSDENTNIFLQYIQYGDGKIANLGIKFEDEITRNKLRMLLDTDKAPINIEISHNYFDGKIKSKFQELGEIELYEKYYEFTNMFSHSMWPAIFTNTYNICTNAMHEHYLIDSGQIEVVDVYEIALECWIMINEQNIEYICEL